MLYGKTNTVWIAGADFSNTNDKGIEKQRKYFPNRMRRY